MLFFSAEPLFLLLPQPTAAKARKTIRAASAVPPSRRFQALLIPAPPLPPSRLRRCVLGATRDAPAGHGPPARRRRSFRGSVGSPSTLHPRRARRRSASPSRRRRHRG